MENHFDTIDIYLNIILYFKVDLFIIILKEFVHVINALKLYYVVYI